MSSTISLLDEKHFLCCLCRDIFNDPATLPCGHSSCLSCLRRYWARHQSKYCPYCKRVFTDELDLCVNHILADVSDKYRMTRPQKPPEDEMVCPYSCFLLWWYRQMNYGFSLLLQDIDVEQMIQERLQKIERLKHSMALQKVHYKSLEIYVAFCF